jgi:hypothetical protein
VLIDSENALAHCQVLVPSSELHIRAGERVVTLDNGSVKGRHERGVQEVEEIGRGRPKSLDALFVKPANGGDDILFIRTAAARIQETAEVQLVGRRLVDVRNSELRLPEKRVVGTLEDLPLLGNRPDDGLERRPLVDVPERPVLDFSDDTREAAADRAKVLKPLFPQKPRSVRRVGVVSPAPYERTSPFVCQLVSLAAVTLPKAASGSKERRVRGCDDIGAQG